MRVRVAGLVAVAAALPQALAQCGTYVDEPTCEADETCYWKKYSAPQECREIPSLNADCECTVSDPDDCGANRDGGSGCEPRRFCAFVGLSSPSGCGVVNPITDSDCVENGDSTCECIPTEFCEQSVTTPPTSCPSFFGNGFCRIIRPPTETPTAAPTGPTPEPSAIDLDFNPDEAQEDIVRYLTYGGGAAGGVIVLAAIFCLYIKRAGRFEDPNLRGVVTASEYMAHARPIVPKLPDHRQSLTPQEAAEMEGMKLIVTYDFDGENDDELSCVVGDFLIGLVKYEEWWEARTQDGGIGLIPQSYVSEVGLTEGVVDERNLEISPEVDF